MPDPDLEISERPVILTLRKGGGKAVSKQIFSLGPQFGLKTRGAGPPAPPLNLPLVQF